MAQIPQIQNYGIPALDYSGVGKSLAQLGQQVGQTLAMREYQRQAQAELPYMQEAMRNAMNKISSGDVAGGYGDAMMNLPLASQNPIVAAAAQNYFNGMQQAAEFQQKAAWQTLQQNMMTRKSGGAGGAGGGLPVMSGTEQARQRMGIAGSETAGGAMAGEREAIDAMAEEQLPTDQIQVDQKNQDMVATGGMEAQFSDTEVSAANNAAALANAPTDQRGAMIQNNIAKTQGIDTTGYKKVNVPGLEEFYGTSEIFIPPAERTITTSTSAKSSEGDYRETLSEVLIGKEDYEKNLERARKIPQFISIVKGQRPAGSDKKIQTLFNEAGGFQNITLQPNDGEIYDDTEKFPMLMYYAQGKEPVALNDKQAEAVSTIYGLSAQAPSAGWVFGKGGGQPVTPPTPTPTPMQNRPPLGSFFGIK